MNPNPKPTLIQVRGDVLVGADGIWSAVRAAMRNEPAKGEGSGVSYSGYTVFAGELTYGGQVGRGWSNRSLVAV